MTTVLAFSMARAVAADGAGLMPPVKASSAGAGMVKAIPDVPPAKAGSAFLVGLTPGSATLHPGLTAQSPLRGSGVDETRNSAKTGSSELRREKAGPSTPFDIRLAALRMTDQLTVTSGQWPAKAAVGGARSKAANGFHSAFPKVPAFFGTVTLTQITDTVYRADGSKAKGTLLISWPAFTTATQGVIAAGSMSVTLGPDGLFSASLAPTAGSTPTGVYYTVVYQLDDGTNKQEYWSVPATDVTTISAVRSKLVPANVAAQFMTRDQADSAYVHANDSQTINGVKTFNAPPVVPDPQKATDAANKEYVDANTGGGANLASPPPIGNVTPNSVAGNPVISTAGPNGDASFNALRTAISSEGELSIQFLKKDGTPSNPLRHAFFVPWFQAPNMNQGMWSFPSSVQFWNIVGGIVAQGRMNLFPLLDPGPNQVCSVTHTGAGGSGSPTYHARFVDSNSGHSLPSVGCSDPSGYSIAEMNATHINHVQVWQPQYPLFGGGWSNVVLDRGDPINAVVNTPGHVEQGVLSTFSACQAKQSDNAAYCGWDDDGSYSATTLAALEGAFYNATRNTSASAVIEGTLWTQGGNSLAGGTNHQGRMVTQAFGDPSAPNVHANTTGTTPYSYAVVYRDLGLGVTNPSPLATITNGAATPNNTITWDCFPFFQTADLLVSTDGGVTYSSIATGLPCEGSNYPTGTPSPYSFTDTGQARTAYSPMGRNTTADIYADSTAQSGIYALNGEMRGKYLVGTNNATAPYIFGKDGVSGHGSVFLRGNDTNSGTVNWVDSAGATYATLGGDAAGGPLQLSLNLANPIFAQRQGAFWAPQVVAAAPPYSGYGWVSMYHGNSGTTGFIGWQKSDGMTQSWHMGGDPGDNLTLSADSGGTFNIAAAVTVNSAAVAGDLTMRDIPGHEYFVSKYSSIQVAIDAAYNNGSVLGNAIVVDDRTSPYTGEGWIVHDSVTLKLAGTTYTINGTVQFNNGVKTVVAGIIMEPGSHMVGVGTSANHGTNINAANGLNADIIATSTVGTGVSQQAQWWHWGSLEGFHMDGNKAHQTAGNCINVENMGETAMLRSVETGNCFADDIHLEGNFATQSEIANITVNSAGNFGVNLNNFQGVGVLRGLSGDSNATSIIRFNGNQSATLTVLGLKAEEEISGQDPLITLDMPADGSEPAFYLVGGYTYGRPGLKDVIKVINGKLGAGPFVQVSNFYVDGNFTNGVNDTVNGRVYLAANMSKVPFSYLPTGAYMSGQAFTFAPNTFIQGGSSALTEIFGSNTDSSTMIAAQGNGDGTSYFTGGLKIGIPNRAQYGASPEMMARMGSRFLGVGQGYDTNTWVFVPIWKAGDSSNRWIGEPNQRWPEVYAADVNSTTATVGTLNVTNCNGCINSGPRLLNYQVNTAALTGNNADQTIYNYTVPAGTMPAGTGMHCWLKAQRVSGSGSITYKWKFGTTTVSYAAVTSGSQAILSDMEVFNNPGSTTGQLINLGELHAGNNIMAGAILNSAAAENTANTVAVNVSFNGASTEQLKGVTFKCMAEQ
jgi:hypothetical protein